MTTRKTGKLYSLVPLMRAADAASMKRKKGEKHAAIGAFNVNFYAQAEGILLGLQRAGAPGIIQASKGANKFQGGPDKIQNMVLLAMKNLKTTVPVCLHLDHGDYEAAAECIAKGFSSVMIDYSTKKTKKDGKTVEEKRSVEQNAYLTRPIVLAAHERGLSVEGEMGVLAGVEEDVIAEHSIYPTPVEVLNYARISGVDAIAVACGTCHGPVKHFVRLEHDLLKAAYRKMKAAKVRALMVLHGSSTVPPELVDEINKFGGKLSGASGVPMVEIKKAVMNGVRKINIDTDLRLGITATFRRYLHEHPGVGKMSPALAQVNQVFDGTIQGKDKDGNLVDPGSLTDPRSYLEPLMKSNPALLREDYRNSDDAAFKEVMGLVRERIAQHVEKLVNEFGSAGIAGTVR